MIYIANWKQNKAHFEVNEWLEDFESYYPESKLQEHDKMVLCPPVLYMEQVHEFIIDHNLKLSLGAQDVSIHLQGAHTGELGVFQLADFAEYCIVGHSERRAQGETPDQVNHKIENLAEYNLIPIVCFSSMEEFRAIKKPEHFVSEILYAYEPLDAIGTGNPADPKSVEQIIMQTGLQDLIYGGSVKPDNIKVYKDIQGIGGFLVGGASLSCRTFLDLTE